MNVVTEIEQAFTAHWSLFGRWAHGEVHEDNGVLWFETPIKHLPYNGVIRTRIENDDPDAVAVSVLESFRARGVDFFWVVHPSAQPDDLSERLTAHGLEPVEKATGMSLELAEWERGELPGDVVYREVLDDADLEAYMALTLAYWEVPEEDAALVARYQREWGPGVAPGHRYLALIDSVPVGKGYLSLAGPPGVAALYGMSTRPEARGRGVAAGLTAVLLERAKEAGCRRAVLHSSDMAVGVYRRAGFAERCHFTFCATTQIWSNEY